MIARRATAGVAALSGLCLPATLAIAGFDAGVEYETGVEPVAVTSADFDHDGNKDLAVTNLSEGDVSVLEANFVGDGTFEGHVRYTVGAGPTAIVATDLDRDGNKDLAVTTEGQDEVAILEAGFSGNGTFEPADDYDVGDTPIAVAAADFTSDGRKDLVVANFLDDNVSLLECKRNGTLKPALDTPVGRSSSFACAIFWIARSSSVPVATDRRSSPSSPADANDTTCSVNGGNRKKSR